MGEKVWLVCDTGYEHTSPMVAFKVEADAKAYIAKCVSYDQTHPEWPKSPDADLPDDHPDVVAFDKALARIDRWERKHPNGLRRSGETYYIHEIEVREATP